MNVCHNNTTLTLKITCLCYLKQLHISSNIDMLLTSVSISTASGAMCEKKEPLCFNLVKVIMVLLLELKMRMCISFINTTLVLKFVG